MDFRSTARPAPASISAERLDQGLRSYMLSVYNYMGIALVLTGLTAFVTSQSPRQCCR